MSEHVYARLAGHGWILLPRAPFEFERMPDRPQAVDVSHQSANGPRNARIDCTTDPPQIDLGPRHANAGRGTRHPDGSGTRRLVHRNLRLCLPLARRVHLHLRRFAESSRVLPDRSDRSLIFVQGPVPLSRIPVASAMAAPDRRCCVTVARTVVRGLSLATPTKVNPGVSGIAWSCAAPLPWSSPPRGHFRRPTASPRPRRRLPKGRCRMRMTTAVRAAFQTSGDRYPAPNVGLRRCRCR